MKDLTEKQKTFCLEYLKDFNATRAATEAGYSKKSVRAIASELLTNPNIQAYLRDQIEKRSAKAKIDIELILSHLYNMAFFDPRELLDDDGDLLPPSQWPDVAARVIQGLDIQTTIDEKGKLVTVKKIKIPSRERNTENLGRYLSMFTDKIKDVSDPKEVIHYYVPEFRQEGDPVKFGNNGDGDDDGGNGRYSDDS